MSDIYFPDENSKSCRVSSYYRCNGANVSWADAYGNGDSCDSAQEDMYQTYKKLCFDAGEGDPIFGTINWRCSCDVELS